jgi:hypothetical protein
VLDPLLGTLFSWFAADHEDRDHRAEVAPTRLDDRTDRCRHLAELSARDEEPSLLLPVPLEPREARRLAACATLGDRAISDQWADAHDTLLRSFIATCARAAENTKASTAAFVADEELRAWAAVKSGAQPFVRENTYYVQVDPELHRALFGDGEHGDDSPEHKRSDPGGR